MQSLILLEIKKKIDKTFFMLYLRQARKKPIIKYNIALFIIS